MRGILLKRFFPCRGLSTTSAPNGWARKRRCTSSSLPLPRLKRQKLMLLKFRKGGAPEEEEVEESDGGSEELPDCLIKPAGAQGGEKQSLYPSVAYEGNAAIVKLGVDQMVTLDGCATVQLVEGQASMLGYSLRQGMDVLVSSSSKLAEVITIDSPHVPEEVDSLEASNILGCQLRFFSHSLGQNTLVSGRALSSKLGFIGPLGKRIQDEESYDMNEPESDDEVLELDSDVSYSDSKMKRRKMIRLKYLWNMVKL